MPLSRKVAAHHRHLTDLFDKLLRLSDRVEKLERAIGKIEAKVDAMDRDRQLRQISKDLEGELGID